MKKKLLATLIATMVFTNSLYAAEIFVDSNTYVDVNNGNDSKDVESVETTSEVITEEESYTEIITETENEVQTEDITESETEAQSKDESETEAQSEDGSETEAQSEDGSETETQKQTEVESEVQTESTTSSTNVGIGVENTIQINNNTGTIFLDLSTGIVVDANGKPVGEANVNVVTGNIVQINNNKGVIYLNMDTGIVVDANGNKTGDANIDVLVENNLILNGNDNEDKSSETTTEEYTETTTETTETTTKRNRSRSSSSRNSGGSSSSNASKIKKASNDNKKIEETKPIVKQSKTKAVAMTIGSRAMNVNGKIIKTDSSPYISNGYTLCPIRCISTAFDAEVSYDATTKTAIVKTNDTEAKFTFNSKNISINGKVKAIDISPEIKAGRMYLPLRVLAESLGANVSWIPESKSILLIVE